MLLNNIEQDLKLKLIEKGTTQRNLAKELGVSPVYLNHVLMARERIVNKFFIRMLDALGYDIEIMYKKKS